VVNVVEAGAAVVAAATKSVLAPAPHRKEKEKEKEVENGVRASYGE
jgi:hypothetical protein